MQRLLDSYRAIPLDATVRLAKPTSNLFRTRTRRDAPGLDTSGLTGVIAVDRTNRTADVQGMCSFETLVAATLPYGLSPLVVPQLKTITVGGAVTGLGIESASFRNGLPHESVVEMDILTGAGESYLCLGMQTSAPGPVSDYTGRAIYYRSIRQRGEDRLTIHDYLWRWDTDWFWCSRAFGAQHPVVRRLWPRRYRRSSVYWELIGYDQRFGIADRIEAFRGRPPRERVVQDIEVPIEHAAEFLDWFLREVPIEPVWLCPLRLRDPAGWPLYPLAAGHTYVNIGFWSSVPAADTPGAANRRIEQKVSDLNGHKSLYSDAFYDRDEFDRLYGGDTYKTVKKTYDPETRLLDLYAKAVQRR